METPAVDKSLIRSNSPTPREQQAVHHNENLAADNCFCPQEGNLREHPGQQSLPPKEEQTPRKSSRELKQTQLKRRYLTCPDGVRRWVRVEFFKLKKTALRAKKDVMIS